MEAIKVHQGGNKSTRRQRAIDLLNLVGIPDPASRLDAVSYTHLDVYKRQGLKSN